MSDFFRNDHCFFSEGRLECINRPLDLQQPPYTCPMLILDEREIAIRVAASGDVQSIRARIARAAEELERAHSALRDVPLSVRASLFEEKENALEALHAERQRVEERAREWAIRALKSDHVDVLRAQAQPHFQKAEKAFNTAREELLKVLEIEREANQYQGRLLVDAFDHTSIDYHVPTLTRFKDDNRWQLKR
jgi:cellobiose-specific phosphotransferase system component IIA